MPDLDAAKRDWLNSLDVGPAAGATGAPTAHPATHAGHSAQSPGGTYGAADAIKGTDGRYKAFVADAIGNISLGSDGFPLTYPASALSLPGHTNLNAPLYAWPEAVELSSADLVIMLEPFSADEELAFVSALQRAAQYPYAMRTGRQHLFHAPMMKVSLYSLYGSEVSTKTESGHPDLTVRSMQDIIEMHLRLCMQYNQEDVALVAFLPVDQPDLIPVNVEAGKVVAEPELAYQGQRIVVDGSSPLMLESNPQDGTEIPDPFGMVPAELAPAPDHVTTAKAEARPTHRLPSAVSNAARQKRWRERQKELAKSTPVYREYLIRRKAKLESDLADIQKQLDSIGNPQTESEE